MQLPDPTPALVSECHLCRYSEDIINLRFKGEAFYSKYRVCPVHKRWVLDVERSHDRIKQVVKGDDPPEPPAA